MTREEILVVAKPILFNTEMVRAILDGRKKVTRRLIKPPSFVYGDENNPKTLQVLRTAPKGSWLYRQIGKMPCLDNQYRIGNYLYVRETWCNANVPGVEPDYYYYADAKICEDYDPTEWKWSPSIHMPKEAARIFLRVKDVRAERLKDISVVGLQQEGIDCSSFLGKHPTLKARDLFVKFSEIWDSKISQKDLDKYGWDANPWVWVIQFERVEV